MRKLENYEMDNLKGGGFWTGLACGLGVSLTVGALTAATGGAGLAVIGAAAAGGFSLGGCSFGIAVKHFEGYDF